MLSKQKLSLIGLLVFLGVLCLSGFRLSQILYINQEMKGIKGKHPPLYTQKLSNRITKKCMKKNEDFVSKINCILQRLRINLIVYLILFIVSLIGLIVCIRKLIKS